MQRIELLELNATLTQRVSKRRGERAGQNFLFEALPMRYPQQHSSPATKTPTTHWT